MIGFVQVTTTTDCRDLATQIAQALVESRLAACVQISGPIFSVYRWQEKVEQADEWLCTVKTRKSLFPAVEASIRERHSYDCPEILAVPLVAGNAAYLEWLNSQLLEDPTG